MKHYLILCHVIILTASNILVQYPFAVLGFHTTWGAFTYPAIFILTDLTTRLSTAQHARNNILKSMLPALLISYSVASYLEVSHNGHWQAMFSFHITPLRIALASFIAYVIGQLLDIIVFQKYRSQASWWLAPTLSSTMGNLVDTLLFFTIAFYHCSNPFMSQHWPEIAIVDSAFKISISLIAFVPAYGFILNSFGIQFRKNLTV